MIRKKTIGDPLFRESMRDLRDKIAAFIVKYGNSQGGIDKQDFSELLKDKKSGQNNRAIARILAINVRRCQDAPELEPENVRWAFAFRVYKYAENEPEIFNLDVPPVYLNAMTNLARIYMLEEEPQAQASMYLNLEDLKRYGSDYEQSVQFRRIPETEAYQDARLCYQGTD